MTGARAVPGTRRSAFSGFSTSRRMRMIPSETNDQYRRNFARVIGSGGATRMSVGGAGTPIVFRCFAGGVIRRRARGADYSPVVCGKPTRFSRQRRRGRWQSGGRRSKRPPPEHPELHAFRDLDGQRLDSVASRSAWQGGGGLSCGIKATELATSANRRIASFGEGRGCLERPPSSVRKGHCDRETAIRGVQGRRG